MKRMSYRIDELMLKNDSDAEQVRTRTIFDALKALAVKGGKLSEYEKNFFCIGVTLSSLNEGSIEDYECCDNPKFKFLYLVYFHDLTGGSKYLKPLRGEFHSVAIEEAQKDLHYLEKKADAWEQIIMVENHSDQLLLQVAKETRIELKELDSQPEFKNDILAKGTFRYRYKKIALLLQLKYIFHIAQEILETEIPLEIKIGNTIIEINEYSLIHIINRHYSRITKQYDTGKTFHTEEFKPGLLSKKLHEIFTEVNNTQYANQLCLQKILFKYVGQLYVIWTQERSKFIKNIGEVNFTRVDSFYPVDDKNELIEIAKTYNEIKINNEISIYIKRRE